jgi:hypothetical protein
MIDVDGVLSSLDVASAHPAQAETTPRPRPTDDRQPAPRPEGPPTTLRLWPS